MVVNYMGYWQHKQRLLLLLLCWQAWCLEGSQRPIRQTVNKPTNSNLTKECDCMTWLYLVVMIFSALTLYFTYGEYKQNRFSKKAFTLVSIMEAVVIVATTVMLIMSLWPIPIWRIEAGFQTLLFSWQKEEFLPANFNINDYNISIKLLKGY